MPIFSLRCSDEEMQRWKDAAEHQGVAIGAWIRWCCNPAHQLLPDGMPLATIYDAATKQRIAKLSNSVIEVLKEEEDIRIWPKRLEGRKPCKHGLLFCKTCK